MTLRYVSTRGQAPILDFEAVLLTGLARDGGLYVPEILPRFSEADLRAMAGLSYAELAARVMEPFIAGAIAADDFADLVADAYDGFGHRAVAPLRQLERDEWLLELFHGPTLAFKDYPLQLLGRLFDHVLGRRGERVTIVGATSGDTGSAAIEACRDREALDIFILHPKGRVSEVQRRQMTTVDAANVHNIAIDGTFDDCQDLVKGMFNDVSFRDALNLSAVNSINWARIMAQTVYYFAAALALGAPERRIAFSVPTGNFGNVFAGYVAAGMGLPISQLVVATNRNDILARFFEGGEMSARPVEPSLSPSMDIQVSSNFERLLFDMMGRDGGRVADAIEGFRAGGSLTVDPQRLAEMRALFDAGTLDDPGTLAEIRATWRSSGILLDPHSAVGVAVGRRCRRETDAPLVTLATAHPAKFPDAVEQATGVRPDLPERLADLFDRPERMDTVANELARVQDFVRARVSLQGAA
jgi:threonine synthase